MADKLLSILSGEPLPVIPPSDDPETEKWRRDLVNYLRRLSGSFKDDNLPSGDGAAAGDIDDLNRTIFTDDVTFTSGRWVLTQSAPFGYTITSITHRASANQTTFFDLFVNGSQRTGTGDDSPSTTEGIFVPTNGLVAVGDLVEIDLDIQAANGAFTIAFTIKRTRT